MNIIELIQEKNLSKISIIGPPSSGKTYFSKRIKDFFGCCHHDLDKIMYTKLEDKYVKNPTDLIESNIKKLLENDKWIIEGMYLVDEVFKEAEVIFYMHTPIVKCLYRQWRRYLSDPEERKYFTIFNNFKLSYRIIFYFLTHKAHVINNPEFKKKVVHLKQTNRDQVYKFVESDT